MCNCCLHFLDMSYSDATLLPEVLIVVKGPGLDMVVGFGHCQYENCRTC